MLNSYVPQAQGILRIAAGVAFWSHGAQKLLGWFGGVGPDGGTVELMSRYGLAGVIELVGGTLLVLGLFTRVTAFITSGEMAAAYFIGHVANGGLWWWANRGELAMVYCFVWLFFAAAGAGAFSVDGVRAARAKSEERGDRANG